MEQNLTDGARILGPDHPKALISRYNLAFLYLADGRLREALPLFEQTLTDCEQMLGPTTRTR